WWTLKEFCDQQLLPYVFADAEDDRQQYTIVIHQVAARLRRYAEPFGDNGAVLLEGKVLTTYEDLVNLIVERLTDDDTRADWAGPRPRHRQRVRPAAALLAAAAERHHPGRPGRRPAARHLHLRPAAHRRRPAQPARARAAFRGRRGARRRDGAQGGGGPGRPAV